MLGTPDPIAFSIFGHDIRWYALLMCTAFIIGLILARYRTKKEKKKNQMFHKLPILKFFLESTFHLFGCRVHGKNDSLGVHEESSAGSVRYPVF